MNSIYENGAGIDAEGLAYRILGVAKVGAAATDSTLNIDVSDGFTATFEIIAHLTDELIEALERERGGAK